LLVWSYDHPLPISFIPLAISVGAIIGLVIIRQIIVLNENVQFYIEAQQEIAERKRVEMEVKRLNEELEQRVIYRTSELKKANVDLLDQIHERQLAEDALRNSERRLADIINFLPDATFVINKSGVVIAWNRAIEKMTGIAAKDMVGKGDYEYSLPFYEERVPSLIDLVCIQIWTIRKGMRASRGRRTAHWWQRHSYLRCWAGRFTFWGLPPFSTIRRAPSTGLSSPYGI